MSIKVKLLVNLKIGPEEIATAGSEYNAADLTGLPDFIQYEVENRKYNVVVTEHASPVEGEGEGEGEKSAPVEEKPKRRGRS